MEAYSIVGYHDTRGGGGQSLIYRTGGEIMCLAVPVKLKQRDGDTGIIEQDGVCCTVSLVLVPEAAQGDYVLVHAGFAIQRLIQEEARKSLDLLAGILSEGGEGP